MQTKIPTDPLDAAWGVPGWPEWVTSFRSHQLDAWEEIMSLYAGGTDVVLLDAPTGCLAAGTEIIANRGGAARRYSIERLVHSFNGGATQSAKKWDLSIPTMVQRCQVAPKWGPVVRSVTLKAAYYSGRKETWVLTTEHGRSIQATADHRFALDGGEMVALSDLKPGDPVLVNNGRSSKGARHRALYQVVQGLVNHPLRGEWPYRQPLHRLVVEANINGLRLDWYIAILRDGRASTEGLTFLSALDAVHHQDRNTNNNELNNLEVKSHLSHWRDHGLEGAWAHVALQVGGDIVASVEYAGETETFDLTVDDDPHNFIANEFVVHNSGKTIIAEGARRLLRAPRSAYIASTNSLLHQFHGDFDYSSPLKGKSNYPTLDHPELFDLRGDEALTCADCMPTMAVLPACGNCPQNESMPSEAIGATSLEDTIEQRSLHCDHCFIGTTVLESAETDSVFKRWFEGDVVTIKTASGNELTGTPNHPIATEKGWIALGELVLGGNVVSGTLGQRKARRDPDVENKPPDIAEVTSAIQVALGRVADKRVPGVLVDFHGDGMDGDVDVISINRELSNGTEPTSLQPFLKLLFALTDKEAALLPYATDGGERLFTSDTSTDGLMRGGGHLRSLLGGHLRGSVELSLTAIAQGNTGSLQGATDQRLADPQTQSESDDRFPFKVTLDEIVHIERRSFAGHVYNLSTKTNWYLANGIVAHNCHPFAACPYRDARFVASNSPLVVTNTAYFIADTQLAANSVLDGRDFVIVDECDTLESILMGHIEVNISKRTAQELDLKPPDKKTVESAWVEWLESEAKPKVKAAIDSHRSRKSATPRWMKQKVRLDRLAGKLVTLTTELADSNAVYDGYDKGDIIFRPVKVDLAAPKLFWERSRRWLAMSATLFPDEFIDSTGLDHTDLKVDVVRVPSTFPVERRPIYYKGVANNVYKERDTAWPKIADGIVRTLDSRPDSRTLIHTVSYGFTAFLDEYFIWENPPAAEREIISYTKSSEREGALARFKNSDGPAVLLAPSMDRGIDLPGEECELIIITKMPFMSTNDKQVNKRMYSPNGRLWYSTQTLKSLVQMTGRGMRSADDLCECVILDEQFLTNVWRNNRRLLPDWWTESVDFGGGGI